ncbi:helix-turn-helix domain-containing protein [endosymbiont of unidentified scaly snail isolate Monju]|uniref:helix-turn-helix domain-containing protein n=1 Tax=endosymbiont of unidentified scaly snail isolate Monju TaxID=1248727 RepID=UPI0003892513|nr:helix-turn-helix transcriptional regulator [endosymbiont of unidentified scaly snail isolate Monju]BAN69032.1 hypothetical protein EBS_1119 [endosymbiont of unidentified scaly snail isolate Monju]
MNGLFDEERQALEWLGQRLRLARKRRGDRQSDAAARCRISRETYRKMERGEPGVAIGIWVRAIAMYGELEALLALFPASPFDEITS